MSLHELNDGFEQYLNQKFSPEERQKFINWLASKENEEKVRQYLYDQLKNFSDTTEIKDVNFDRIYSNITDVIDSDSQTNYTLRKPTNNFIGMILKVAAIALIIILSTFLINKIIQPKPLPKVNVVYYEIKAPLGAKTEIILPDGSHVWLNAGSKLKYNAGFSLMNRDIILDGEAFFNVAKNKNIPFIVKTSDIDIKAVGTSFNVKAYSEEGTIETTLIEGKIAIIRSGKTSSISGELYLEPNQRATFVKEKTSFEVNDIRKFIEELPPQIKVEPGKVYIIPKIDPDPIIAWKEDRMIIRGEEMESLVIKLERKYNVQMFITSDYVKKFRFSGTLDDETLQQVLDVIKLSAPIDYTIEGRSVTIKENSELRKRFKRYLKNEK